MVLTMADPCIAADAPTPPARDSSLIEVARPDGSRQCEPDTGEPLATAAAALAAAGIQVHASRTGNDGMMYPQVCGAPTGTVHIFSIAPADLAAAMALGFRPLPP